MDAASSSSSSSRLGFKVVMPASDVSRFLSRTYRSNFVPKTERDYQDKQTEYHLKMELDGKKFSLFLNQEPTYLRIPISPKIFYKDAMATILSFNIESKHSFPRIQHRLEAVEKFSLEKAIVKMVVGVTGSTASAKPREVSYQEAKDFCDELGLPYFEVDLQTKENIVESLTFLAEEVMRKHASNPLMNYQGEPVNSASVDKFRMPKKITEKTLVPEPLPQVSVKVDVGQETKKWTVPDMLRDLPQLPGMSKN